MCSQEKHVYHWKNEEKEICGKSDFGSREDWRMTTMNHGRVTDAKDRRTRNKPLDRVQPTGLCPLRHNLHS